METFPRQGSGVIDGSTRSLRPARTVFVLVNPAGFNNSPEQVAGDYQKRSKRANQTVRQEFTPRSVADFVLFSPWGTSLLDSALSPIPFGLRSRWQNLYVAMKLEALVKGIGGNVFTTPRLQEISFESNLGYNGSKNPEARAKLAGLLEKSVLLPIRQAGFEITPDTEVAVGGEFLDTHVRYVVRRLLTLKPVNRIRVPKATTFLSIYKDCYRSPEMEEDALARFLQGFNHDSSRLKLTVDDKNYFLAPKDPETYAKTYSEPWID